MSVFRVAKNRNYTIMSNHHLKDKNLSFKAKGLLSYMLSLPDDWDYSLVGLCKASKDNKTAIQSTLKELKEYNYLEITRERTEKGQFEWVYNIFEKPKPYTDFPYMENPSTENQPQLNTKKINTKKKKDKRKKNLPQFLEVAKIDDNLYEN